MWLGAQVRSSLAAMLLATSVGAAGQGVSDEAALIQLSNDWMRAITRKDRDALERIVADDFVLQMPGDAPTRLTRRDEWIANAIAMDWSDFRYENVTVAVHGEQATVTSRLHFRVSPIPVGLDSGIVDIWQKRDGRWQVKRRYLGESQMQLRIVFFAGILATLLAGAVVYVAVRLFRRRRRLRHA